MGVTPESIKFEIEQLPDGWLVDSVQWNGLVGPATSYTVSVVEIQHEPSGPRTAQSRDGARVSYQDGFGSTFEQAWDSAARQAKYVVHMRGET